ncbi:hypothetical protein I308_106482 [Cryptococcus tetragattii IND107]|uniref:Uncharacterized protein n=1 Tax=Cryptococcus tetragattii IND107 TaxID=1296105 RepID=A0ABR3BJ12_9TREE
MVWTSRKTLTAQIHESRVEERFSSSTCVLQMKRHSRPPASTLISVTSHYAVPAVTVLASWWKRLLSRIQKGGGRRR